MDGLVATHAIDWSLKVVQQHEKHRIHGNTNHFLVGWIREHAAHFAGVSSCRGEVAKSLILSHCTWWRTEWETCWDGASEGIVAKKSNCKTPLWCCVLFTWVLRRLCYFESINCSTFALIFSLNPAVWSSIKATSVLTLPIASNGFFLLLRAISTQLVKFTPSWSSYRGEHPSFPAHSSTGLDRPCVPRAMRAGKRMGKPQSAAPGIQAARNCGWTRGGFCGAEKTAVPVIDKIMDQN